MTGPKISKDHDAAMRAMCAAAGVEPEPSIASFMADMAKERQARADRQRARDMFRDAGKPIPAWAQEPTGYTHDLDASVCIETEGELLHNAKPDGEP